MKYFNDEFKILTYEELLRVHALTLEVLQKKGIVFYSETAREVLQKYGAYIDGLCVHFSQTLVENVLSHVPSGFLWNARNAERSLFVGEGQAQKVYIMQDQCYSF